MKTMDLYLYFGGAFDLALPASPLPEEAPCARPSSNFYSSAAIVERTNSTDLLEEHASLPTSTSSFTGKVGKGACFPDYSGRGWKSPI